jgi:hypothetical protein
MTYSIHSGAGLNRYLQWLILWLQPWPINKKSGGYRQLMPSRWLGAARMCRSMEEAKKEKTPYHQNPYSRLPVFLMFETVFASSRGYSM